MNTIELSEINIIPLHPQNGLVGFASCVINNQFYVGSIAIYTCLVSSDGFRLVFPNKKLSSGKIVDCFYPINKLAEQTVRAVIIKKYLQLMDNFKFIES